MRTGRQRAKSRDGAQKDRAARRAQREAVRAALRDALTWMGQRTDDTEERRRIIAAGWAALEGLV